MALTYEELLGIQKKRKKKEEEARKKIAPNTVSDIAPYKLVEKNVKSGFTAPTASLKPTVTTSKKDEDDSGLLKKSSYFDDGYDFGDISKTVIGSVADLGEWFSKGVIEAPEKILDGLTVLGTAMNRANMNQANFNMMSSPLAVTKKGNELASGLATQSKAIQKESEKEAAKFIAKDLYDSGEIAKKIIRDTVTDTTGIDVQAASVFGDQSRSLAESAGNMTAVKLADLILPGAGTLAMGLSAGGGELEEALRQGATYDEAMASGIITAGAEMAGGALFNGVKFGGETLTAGAVKKVATALSGKVMQTLAKWGINTVGEGAEELVSDFISSVGRKVTYLDEKEFNEIFNKESAWESFLGGMIIGGFFEGVDIAASKVTGTDYVTGEPKNALNEDVKKVFDKVVEDRIAKATEDNGGKTISKRKENEIRQDVLRAINKGYLDTDTIESILDSENYDKYKRISEKGSAYESKLKEAIGHYQAEYDSFSDIPRGEMTRNQLKREADVEKKLEELKAELEEYKKDTSISDLKTKLSQSVLEKVKNTELAESYREAERNKQKLEADTSKYKNENARQTVQNAIDSGLFGNGNRAKEFVDFAAKLSADRGYVIEFTDTEGLEKLKQEGNKYNLEADVSRIEAFVSDKHKRIVINADVHKSFDSLIGHEITHTLEQAKSYKGLHKAIKSYLGDEEYNKALESFKKRYEGVDAVAEKELVADFCGTRLLTDYDFVKHLSTENRNIFQKVYDEIKYLCKIATAGSKEARQLERVKRNFEKAYKEATKSGAKVEGTKNSISDTKYSLSTEGMSESDIENAQKVIRNLKTNAMSSMYIDGYATYTKERMEREISNSSYSNQPDYAKSYITWVNPIDFLYATTTSEQYRNILKEEAGELDLEKLKNETQPIHLTVDFETGEIVGHEGRHRMIALGEKGVNKVAIVIDALNDNRSNTKPIGFMSLKGQQFAPYRQGTNFYLHNMLPLSQRYADTARELFTNKPASGIQYSLSEADNKYLSAVESGDTETAQKMVDEAARNAGYTIKAYHGSRNEFNVFSKDKRGSTTKTESSKNMFFAADKETANSYYPYGVIETLQGKEAAEKLKNKGKLYDLYIKMDNPLVVDVADYDYAAHRENADAWMEYVQQAEENGNDGIILLNALDNQLKTYARESTVYMFKDSSQAKSAEPITYDDKGNIIPLSERFKAENNDIRYSLTEDSDGDKLTKKQSEYFANTKAVDRNGNLLKVYHTTKNDFTVFDKARKGEATQDANTYLGFFFSDDAEFMQNFPEFENGKTESYYLDMKNPIDMTNISEEAFLDIVEVMGGDVDEAAEIYHEARYNDSPLQLGHLLIDLTGEFSYNDFIKELKPNYENLMSRGYDGVIGYLDEGYGVKEYIVLDSNQAKLTSNKNPSADADVRYSLTEEEAQETNAKLNNVGLKYDNGTVSYSVNSLEDAFNYKTDNKGILLNENDYLKARNEYVDALAKSIAAEKGKPTREEYKKADRYLDSLFLIHDMIAADKDRLDYEAAVNRSAWVGNVEYGGSIDFSTLCAKRRLFTGTFDAIQNALPDTVLTDKDFLNIRNLLLEHGEESPCSMCYVEGSRAKHGVYVDKWLKEYLKTNPEWKPQIADFTSTTRLEQTRIQHPEAYAEYVKAMNKLSQRKPKEASVRTDYKGEILKAFTDDSSIAEKNKNGGIRFNSFSDFEIIHALDCMQVLMDMSRVGLNGQAYTKVKEFAEAFGNTGLKINLSLVAKDVDANGKLVMDEVNGMNYAEAMDIRNRYSDNVGTVIVVFNDAQLKAALADNTIDYVLPFHRSQWRKSQYALMGLPDVTRDYTNIQNDRYKNPKTGRAKKAPNGNIMPNEYWDFTKSGRENAQRYLDYINENSYIPKFDFLLNKVDGKWVLPNDAVGDGYFKLLIDFKMYNNEGVGSPQNPVLPEFNMPYIQQMLNNYVGGHQAFPVAHDVVNEFVEGKKNGKYSLSDDNEIFKDYGRFYGKDIRYQPADIAPVGVAKNTTTTEQVAPTENNAPIVNEDDYAPMTEAEANAMYEADKGYINTFTDADMPPEMDAPIYMPDTSSVNEKTLKNISAMAKDILFLTPKERRAIEGVVQKYSTSESQDETELFNEIKKTFGEKSWSERIEEVYEIQEALKGYKLNVSPFIKRDIADYTRFMRSNFGKIAFSKEGMPVDTAYMELSSAYPNYFPSDIVNPTDQLLQMADVANMTKDETQTAELDDDIIQEAADVISEAVSTYKEKQLLKSAEKDSRAALRDELKKDKDAQKEVEKARKQVERDALNKLSPLERYERKAYARLEADKALLKEELDEAEYNRQVEQLEAETQRKIDAYKVADQRKTKQQEYKGKMESLIGDTSTWKDKKLGISYEVNTLRRNLRDIVRDSEGKRDIAKADAIYDELQGKYNHNEAELNRESNRIKQKFAEMKITNAEDKYIQMLGELRHNPETTLTEDVVKEFYEKHKKHIDEAKVDKIIEEARSMYDDLLVRVNKVLSEQGMKEIPYRKGYFPHFTEDKQGFLGKLFNWKTQNNEIPTSIAGLTEMFEPNRSWQSFNKQRKTDVTDYSFTKGLDSYVQGSLDWIYHIEDIQKRRAFENHIRYTHSEEGIKAKIDAIFNSEEYDADEMQEQIDLVYREARNPLNNFIQDFHTATNTLAGKKSTFDRDLEQRTNRKVYSVMTNLSNRVSGNMVAGSVSSALTNFIPITQSWVEVSPVTSLRAMGETIASTIRDDGTIDKSDFLTNRLNKAENLNKTTWDKVGKGVGFLMDVIDGFTSQTVWRSKYIQNMSRGMSESEAIKNADQFAANVMADRSRGNQPTLFDSKSPVAKIFTAFQLEVNNQYGYFFKDAPQDIANKSKARLIAGYATAFFGAYAYNALYSSLTGRDAAFDPIGIIEELMRDLGFGGDDDEEEEIAPVDVALNLTNNILEEVPFIGGLLGGGRIPISSAMPYGGIMEAFEGTLQDFSEGNYKTLTKEWLNPVYYLAMPMGGGQLRKTNQGLGMFSDDHPVAGSYTDSGNLRFPVEDNLKNRVQAGIFGQYANENARTYFDENYAPLKEKQIKEYAEADMPIADYWKYREGLKDFTKQDEKAAYINGLDISKKQKDVLKSYLYDEEGYKKENPEKYAFLEKEGIGYLGYKELDEDTQSAWSWAFKHQDEYEHYKENGVLPGDYSTYYIPMLDFKNEDDKAYQWAFDYPEKATLGRVFNEGVKEYRQYSADLDEFRADKDENGKTISGSAKEKKKAYIWSLPIDYGQKVILYRSLYDSKEDKATYNQDIIDYLISREDITYDEMNTICEELGFEVNRETGQISW